MTRIEFYIRLAFIAVCLVIFGFALGMIVAGHTNWECIEAGAIC